MVAALSTSLRSQASCTTSLQTCVNGFYAMT